MNVEVVEFYPIDRDEAKDTLTGTLRIRLPDVGIHILGIYVTKKKGFWFFSLPGKNSQHHETGEQVRYPFIVFDEKELQRQLIQAIREKGRAFIEKRLVDTENPLVFPEKRKDESKKVKPTIIEETSVEPKETASIVKPKAKVWKDPPKRNNVARFSSKFA